VYYTEPYSICQLFFQIFVILRSDQHERISAAKDHQKQTHDQYE